MEVEIKIDHSQKEPKVVILTAAISKEITKLARQLATEPAKLLCGGKDYQIICLEPEELFRIYAAGGKVFAVTAKGEYTLRQRLYELEEQLPPKAFIRISKSEIIHLKKVARFDLNVTGTIQVVFPDGSVTYVSRRFVGKIKNVLGI